MNIATAAPYAIAGLIAIGATGYVLHCEHVKKDQVRFIATLESQAAAQKKAAEEKAQRDRKSKEEADAQARKDRSALQRTIDRLRDERARASSVPPAPADSTSPDLACFDRAELTRAVGNLEAGVEGFLAEGDAARVDLDIAKRWAGKLSLEIAGWRLAQSDPGP